MTRTTILRRMVLLLVVCASVVGCSERRLVSVMGPSGSLRVIDATADLGDQLERGELFLVGSRPDGAFGLTRHREQAAIRITAGDWPFGIAREVDSLLVNTPYLEWSWAAQRFSSDRLPVLILAGLSRIDEDAAPSDLTDDLIGLEMPPVNYLLVGYWARSAHGVPDVALDPSSPATGLIRVRDGEPDFGQWHRDGMDLLHATRELWPQARPEGLHVRFVAVAVASSAEDDGALLSELSLHR